MDLYQTWADIYCWMLNSSPALSFWHLSLLWASGSYAAEAPGSPHSSPNPSGRGDQIIRIYMQRIQHWACDIRIFCVWMLSRSYDHGFNFQQRFCHINPITWCQIRSFTKTQCAAEHNSDQYFWIKLILSLSWIYSVKPGLCSKDRAPFKAQSRFYRVPFSSTISHKTTD